MKLELDNQISAGDFARDLAALGYVIRVDGTIAKRHPPGDCDLCGEWTGHRIGGACVPCLNRTTNRREDTA